MRIENKWEKKWIVQSRKTKFLPFFCRYWYFLFYKKAIGIRLQALVTFNKKYAIFWSKYFLVRNTVDGEKR